MTSLPDALPGLDDLDVTLHEPVTKENDMNEARASERADLVELRLHAYRAVPLMNALVSLEQSARDENEPTIARHLSSALRTIEVFCNALPGLIAEVESLRAELSRASATAQARPLSEYHEDMGFVVWWKFPVDEPAWIGTPNDDDWPGYHTHFTPHPPAPSQEPAATASRTVSEQELRDWFAKHVIDADTSTEESGLRVEEVVRYRDLRKLLDRLIPAPSVAEPAKCEECNGTGRVPYEEHLACGACHGAKP